MTNFEQNMLNDFDFTKVNESFSKCDKPILFVFSCGYEKRSLAQFEYLQKNSGIYNINYLCFSFSTYKECGSRAYNEAVLSNHGISPIELEPSDWDSAWNIFTEYLKEELNGDAQIYIDYSSMPRDWYCMLAKNMLSGKIGGNVSLTYSHGKYFGSQYPCVGYGEFKKFSGRPNISATREINIFGLGFDSTRTHGIWMFLDPQLSVGVIARSPNNDEHYQRVIRENPEIISSSNSIHEVDISDFKSMLSTLIDLSRKYQGYGDVALVPDGPKPLVMAMSLVPYYLDEKGIYCWHVGHVKPDDYVPMDVEFSGEYFGFRNF